MNKWNIFALFLILQAYYYCTTPGEADNILRVGLVSVSIGVQSKQVQEEHIPVLVQHFTGHFVFWCFGKKSLNVLKDPRVQPWGIIAGKILLLSLVHESLNVTSLCTWKKKTIIETSLSKITLKTQEPMAKTVQLHYSLNYQSRDHHFICATFFVAALSNTNLSRTGYTSLSKEGKAHALRFASPERFFFPVQNRTL